jgi:hypothetical protein
MKKPRQVLPLLKVMLGFHRFGPLPLLLYLAIAGAILLASSVFLPIGWMEAHARRGFWGEQLFVGCCVWWYFLMLIATPLPFLVLGGATSLEFLFTRAIDRGLWLRTERLAVIIIGLGPLIINLLLSPLGPELAFEPFDPVESGSTAARAQQRYLQVFPGSHMTVADSSGKAQQLVIPHGTEIFAAWLVWFGILCIFLVAAYFSIAFTAWQRAGWHHSKSPARNWLGALMIHVPTYAPLGLLFVCAALRINLFEESFLLFASHPLLLTIALVILVILIQRMTERNIRKMEFEFF